MAQESDRGVLDSATFQDHAPCFHAGTASNAKHPKSALLKPPGAPYHLQHEEYCRLFYLYSSGNDSRPPHLINSVSASAASFLSTSIVGGSRDTPCLRFMLSMQVPSEGARMRSEGSLVQVEWWHCPGQDMRSSAWPSWRLLKKPSAQPLPGQSSTMAPYTGQVPAIPLTCLCTCCCI